MLRWLILAAFATLLLIACSQAVAQPTATTPPVGALPTPTATSPAAAAATDSAVPNGTIPPTTGVTESPPLAGTPTVLITPASTQGTGSTATPGKPNGPTAHPATAAPSQAPTKTPTVPPTRTPTHPPTTPPTGKPTKTPSPQPTPSKAPTPTGAPTPTKAPTPSPVLTPQHDVKIQSSNSSGFSRRNVPINVNQSVTVVERHEHQSERNSNDDKGFLHPIPRVHVGTQSRCR